MTDARRTGGVNNELGEFVAQHQREYSVLGGFDCCTCGWTVHDGSGCATYEEHVEAAWLQTRRALGLDAEIEDRLEVES
ncbi:hypothetical protein PBI_TWEETY_71 [Mycobacterium phage Tweety]|uniref:Uncharacterized protein n=2 Tax=Cheoctovirus TaxID=1623281 RepID=A0A386KT70_9CAUD|nr:hypothetical protein PBI_TWEETY_71 [Mycobacterium phage Tweety]YP_009954551.1 hypothetical protein I5H13_gp072 [Mycobacterium phage ArcusAngelus]ABQ86140.1 hypothetical protein PBI_TWEETY_71 [Mycobacterium phage Tweety]AYD87821.1 hypothetical protein SEA_ARCUSANGELUS_73 [Mycobacterium phage ArcusAngelus]